ncbi:hypothetical protein [Streptococcus pneumoniae]|nr:hypothetical protein [Streptococcus pneumoniae]
MSKFSASQIAIPKPDYREVADYNGLGIDRFKSDAGNKNCQKKG